MKKANKKGFTLVELIIVIAIIGVLAAVLIPTFTGILDKAKISQCTANARNLSTVLRVEAAFEDVPYFSMEKMYEIAAREEIPLESTVKGYSYYYNIAENQIEFLSDEAHFGAEAANNWVASADSTATYPIVVETLNESKPQYRYADLSNSVFRQAIDLINNLPQRGDNGVAAMIALYNSEIKGNTALALAEAHFQYYNPDSSTGNGALYFSENGKMLFDTTTSGATYSFKRAVIQEGTTALATSSLDDTITIKIADAIVIPASVKVIEANSLKSVTSANDGEPLSVIISSNVNVDGLLGMSGVVIENSNAVGDARTIVLSSNQYTLEYGRVKEGVFSDGTTEVVMAPYTVTNQGTIEGSDIVTGGTAIKTGNINFTGTVSLDNTEDYKTTGKTLVRQYAVPVININKTAIQYGTIEKMDVRSYVEDGLRKYSMVLVDGNGDTYIARNVAVITDAGVRYGEEEKNPNKAPKQSLTVWIDPSVKDMHNLQDLTCSVTYQLGSATYKKLEQSKFVEIYEEDKTKNLYWGAATNVVSSFGWVNNRLTTTIWLTEKVDDTHTANRVHATKLEIKKGETVLYVEYYDAEETIIREQ